MKIIHGFKFFSLGVLVFFSSVFPATENVQEQTESIQVVTFSRKILKRLLLVKEKIDLSDLASLPSFNLVMQHIEKGETELPAQLVQEGLSEVQVYSAPASSDKGIDSSIALYVQKIKNDLKDLPAKWVTRVVSPCISSCSNSVCPCPSTAFQYSNTISPAVVLQATSIGSVVESLTINSTANSADCGSGALVVKGGVGIQGSLNVCGTERIANTTNSFSCQEGALVVAGGVGIGQNLNVCGTVTVVDDTQSTSCTSGAVVVAGGQGIGGNLNVCGDVVISSTTLSSGCQTAALVVDGGLSIGQNSTFCGPVQIIDVTASTDCTSGALVVAGGQGIGGNLNLCGQQHIFNTVDSSSCNNGALVVDGGVGIGADVNICGSLNVQGPITTDSFLSINGSPVLDSSLANCNLSIGENTNPIANGTDNTAVGEGAEQNNQLGTDNTAIGCRPLLLNVYGSANSAGGVLTLANLFGADDPNGNGNTAWGYHASYSTQYNNCTTAVGYETLYSNQTDDNTGVGAYALHDNVSGDKLTAVGYAALQYNNPPNTSAIIEYLGSNNTAVGHNSSQYNIEGFENTSVGSEALQYNLVGFSNTAIGSSALNVNESSYNTAVGASSLTLNTIGAFNTAVGADSMSLSTVGYYNTSVGYDNMSLVVAPFYNVSNGVEALSTVINPLRNTVIGYEAIGGTSFFEPIVQLTDNVAVGFESMANTRANANTSVGTQSMEFNVYAIDNTACGYWALKTNDTTGLIETNYNDNTAVGYASLYSLATSNENTAVGSLTYISSQSGEFATQQNVLVGAKSYIEKGSYDVCIGDRANDYGNYDVIIGYDAQNALDLFERYEQIAPTTKQNVIIGVQAYAAGETNISDDAYGDVVIGYQSYARSYGSVAIGGYSRVNGYGSTVVGADTINYGVENVLIGNSSVIKTLNPNGPITECIWNTAVGQSSAIYGYFNTCCGAITQTKGVCNTLVGFYSGGQNTDEGLTGTVAINGNTFVGAYAGGGEDDNSLMGDYNTAVGYDARIVGLEVEYNTAVGSYATTEGEDYSTALGAFAYAKGVGTLAVGCDSTAVGDLAVAVGIAADADGASSVAVGEYTDAVGAFAIAIGSEAYSFGDSSIAIGAGASSAGDNSIAIGTDCYCLGENVIAIGADLDAIGFGSIYIGNPVLNPPDAGCYLQAISLSIQPLFVSWNPVGGQLGATLCAACDVSAGPLEGDMDIDENSVRFLRNHNSKLMQMQPFLDQSRNVFPTVDIVNAGLKVPGDPEEFCPELLVPQTGDKKRQMLQLDKIIVLLVHQLQEHHQKLEDQQQQFFVQQQDIDELHNEIKALKEQIAQLRKIKK